MIVVSIKGPKDAAVKAAAAIAMMYSTGGKVVRRYDNAALAPDPLPACDVAILTTVTSEDK